MPRLNVSFDDYVLNRLRAIARDNRRTAPAQLHIIIEEYIKSYVWRSSANAHTHPPSDADEAEQPEDDEEIEF